MIEDEIRTAVSLSRLGTRRACLHADQGLWRGGNAVCRYSLSNLHADGADLGPAAFSLSLGFTTPNHLLDGHHWGTLWLSAGAEAQAFTTGNVQALLVPATPVPGAVVLVGLGVGLVGWLHRRRTL